MDGAQDIKLGLSYCQASWRFFGETGTGYSLQDATSVPNLMKQEQDGTLMEVILISGEKDDTLATALSSAACHG